jgi:hypothetical protein
MAWDPALLRKYNSTSHFRLLNQIRSELRDQPIQRPLVTSRTAAQGFGSGGRRGGRSNGGAASVSVGSSGAAASSVVAAASSPATSSHATTRRRSAASASIQAAPSSAPHDNQPIIAVPVLTDVVLPDSHTSA